MGTAFHPTSGPVLTRSGDLASILTSLDEGDILFIDEIHRLTKPVEETLYSAMEDYVLDIVVGKGPSARTLRLKLKKFTVVGATTRIGLISSPMRERFGFVHQIDYYDEESLQRIVLNSAKVLGVKIEGKAAREIALRSRGTPRTANWLLKRVRDFSQIKKRSKIDFSSDQRSFSKIRGGSIRVNAQRPAPFGANYCPIRRRPGRFRKFSRRFGRGCADDLPIFMNPI